MKHPTKWDWGKRRGRPWTKSDVECALFLRHCGLNNADIGMVLDRSELSVEGKIGYRASRRYAKSYEAMRPQVVRTWGEAADNFQTIGNA